MRNRGSVFNTEKGKRHTAARSLLVLDCLLPNSFPIIFWGAELASAAAALSMFFALRIISWQIPFTSFMRSISVDFISTRRSLSSLLSVSKVRISLDNFSLSAERDCKQQLIRDLSSPPTRLMEVSQNFHMILRSKIDAGLHTAPNPQLCLACLHSWWPVSYCLSKTVSICWS